MKREHQVGFWYLLAAVIGVVLLQGVWTQYRRVDHIAYNEFRALLEAGKVEELQVGDKVIHGILRDPAPGQKREFVTNTVDLATAELLQKYSIRYTALPESGLIGTVLSWVVPIALFFAMWVFLLPRLGGMGGGGGLLAIGKSKAKIYLEKQTGVTLADVAGVDEAKDELKEIIDFLRDPAGHSRLGARLPKGILLVGPPGTGKTLLARAVAGEAGVPFFSIGGSEFVEMFVGVGAARVRDLFEQARRQAPCIIFIDELDALGRARGSFTLGGHDEKEQTLNQLLAELDGFDTRAGIVLLAATNRPETLDPALLRAGRFDRQVLVDRPDRKGRIDILAVHLRRIRLEPGFDPQRIAALTPGFTGADLANLVNEAALLATRRGGESVTEADFTQAIERIVAGLEKRNRMLNAHERQVIACHETGHALVALAIPGSDPIQKISIIPRGVSALGYTIQRPTEDRFLMDRIELENKIAVLLGGRAAESLTFESVSTGAADDLRRATDIARGMATRFGMVEDLGPVAYEAEAHPFLTPIPGTLPPVRAYSEAMAARIDAAVKQILDTGFERARRILRDNPGLLRTVADRLLAVETITGPQLTELAAGLRAEADPNRAAGRDPAIPPAPRPGA